MKLGQKVGAIRNEGLYVDKDEKRRQQLESLGFVWRMRAPTMSAVDAVDIPFDQIYDALVAYRSEIKPTGPLTVPTEFTVPDAEPWPEYTRGLPLGRSIEQLRSPTYLKKYPGSKEKLEEIGFETDKKMSANDKRFQAVYLALERYNEIYGDLLVPQPFVVPKGSSDWPKESWGLRLGARVNAIRSQGTFIKNNPEREEILDELGFVWNPPERETKRKIGRKTMSEIDAEERAALMQSAKAGQPSLRPGNEGEDDEVESFLSSFDFSDDETDYSDDDPVAGSTWGLEAGAELEDSPSVSPRDAQDFEVDEEYIPPRTLGESLAEAKQRALDDGIIVDSDDKRPRKRKREPNFPWFNDDFGDDFVFEDVVEALTLYKKFYGDFSNLTNAEFVIPVRGEPEFSFDDDFDFDIEMSRKAAAADVIRFDEIDESSMMAEDQIEAELSKKEKATRSSALKEKPKVAAITPLTEVDWPEHLEGMALGDIVMRIRDGSLEVKHLPERKALLDAIDFDWGNPLHFIDVPFEKAMCAMYAYYLVRGDMFVPPDFKMLDEEPWPSALAGYELGKAVARIRELQNFFEAFHRDKLGLLRMIDFVWFPTLALPIDPNDDPMAPENLKMAALGHPNYYQLAAELPFGFIDKIISQGPFEDVPDDDPKNWWRVWYSWDTVADMWRAKGSSDRAAALRRQGFYKLADEHEAQNGPGLFKQIDNYLDALLADIEAGSVMKNVGKKDLQESIKFLEVIDDLRGRWDNHTYMEWAVMRNVTAKPALYMYTELSELSEPRRLEWLKAHLASIDKKKDYLSFPKSFPKLRSQLRKLKEAYEDQTLDEPLLEVLEQLYFFCNELVYINTDLDQVTRHTLFFYPILAYMKLICEYAGIEPDEDPEIPEGDDEKADDGLDMSFEYEKGEEELEDDEYYYEDEEVLEEATSKEEEDDEEDEYYYEDEELEEETSEEQDFE